MSVGVIRPSATTDNQHHSVSVSITAEHDGSVSVTAAAVSQPVGSDLEEVSDGVCSSFSLSISLHAVAAVMQCDDIAE